MEPTKFPDMDKIYPKVSIIIVNWNGVGHLEGCLESIKNQSYKDFEVVLVDNGSKDDSIDYLQTRQPWVKLTVLEKNTGFAAGNNIGLKKSSGEYIVTLNNDTRADKDWLAKLVAVADAHPAVGMVGCRTASFDDAEIVDTLGGRVCRDGMSRGAFRMRRFSSLGMQNIEDAFYPSACAALYKRAMLNETGFFDEDFFNYCEDTDLGLRGRLAGWETLLATDAIVYHKYSGTAGSFSPMKLYLVERNHYWVAVKNFPLRMLLAVPFYSLVRYLLQFRFVLTSKGAGNDFQSSHTKGALLLAVLKGIFAALAGIPRMSRKRCDIMGRRRITAQEMSEMLKQYQMSFSELLDIQ